MLQGIHGTVEGNRDEGVALGVRLHEVAHLLGPRQDVRLVPPSSGEAGSDRHDEREPPLGQDGQAADHPHPVP